MDDEPNPYAAPEAPLDRIADIPPEPSEWKRWWDRNDWWLVLLIVLASLPFIMLVLLALEVFVIDG